MQQNVEIRGVKGGMEGPGGYREVWLLAYPIVITMLSRTAMMFVDSAMVGRLGATELAAVGLAGILTWTLFSFFQGFLGSVNTFVAQRYGAGDRRGITVAAWQGLYLALGSYLIILLLNLFTVPAFALMKPSLEVQRLASIYTQIRLYGGITVFISFGMASFLRGIGDTKTPMRIEIVANLVNLLLDYLLIFGKFGCPRLEVTGAAIATLVAGVVAVICYFAVFLSRKSNRAFQTRSHFHIDSRDLRRILRIGLPMGVHNLMDMGSFTVFVALVGRMGDIALAANNAGVTLISTSFMPSVWNFYGSHDVGWALHRSRSTPICPQEWLHGDKIGGCVYLFRCHCVFCSTGVSYLAGYTGCGGYSSGDATPVFCSTFSTLRRVRYLCVGCTQGSR